MKVAIMQPYFFPYIGYFQLMAAVDKFVILDDVNYIKGGWINRNQISVKGRPHWLTLPIQDASPNRRICDLEIAADSKWKRRTEAMIVQAYARNAFSAEINPITKKWIGQAGGNLAQYLTNLIIDLAARFGINAKILSAQREFPKDRLSGEQRVLEICKELDADVYINAPGGRSLYSSDLFRSCGIDLKFLKPDLCRDFLVSGLGEEQAASILDLLYFNGINEVSEATMKGRVLS